MSGQHLDAPVSVAAHQRAARDSSSSSLVARAARLHYEFGLTHQETASALGLSRVKVTRLLKQARQTGVVKITVASDVSPFAELEEQLAKAAGLREAIVVPSTSDGRDSMRSVLARGAASYLERVIRDGMVVAVGLSRTIAEMPTWLSSPHAARATFVSLVGAVRTGAQGSGNAYRAADALAAAFGGTAEHLHAPVIVQRRVVAEQLRADPSIARTLERAASADIAFVGVGGRSDRIDFNEWAHITADEWAELVGQGMAGDIGGRFFDSNGHEIRSNITYRMIGLRLDEFMNIPVRVIAAGGPSKVEALTAASRAGLITVLVTDVKTAHSIIKDRANSRP